MQDSINKYHILIYDNCKKACYQSSNDVDYIFGIYKEYLTIDSWDLEQEYSDFTNELPLSGNFYCESYASPNVITALILNIDIFSMTDDFEENISGLNHDNIHKDLIKRINIEKSLKSLLT